jgi:hypothetical protein
MLNQYLSYDHLDLFLFIILLCCGALGLFTAKVAVSRWDYIAIQTFGEILL